MEGASHFALPHNGNILVAVNKKLVNLLISVSNELIMGQLLVVHHGEVENLIVAQVLLRNGQIEHFVPDGLLAGVVFHGRLVGLALVLPHRVGVHLAEGLRVVRQLSLLDCQGQDTGRIFSLDFNGLGCFLMVSELFEKAAA